VGGREGVCRERGRKGEREGDRGKEGRRRREIGGGREGKREGGVEGGRGLLSELACLSRSFIKLSSSPSSSSF
jgi:hypothetical protein